MLPPERLPMPPQWRDLLEELAPVFARRSAYRLFTALACGLILADRGTVTGMAAAAGIGRQRQRACWFFAAARRYPDALGIAVTRLIVKYLLKEGDPLSVAVDGTFFRRWGKHVAEARRAYDSSAQGGKKIAFGNTRVIAAIVVELPCCPSPVALPVLFRLWRGKGTASQVQLAAQLPEILVKAFRERQVYGTRDAAFHGGPLVIEGTTWTMRLPASAVISGSARRAPGGGAARESRETGSAPAPMPRRRGLAEPDRPDLRQAAGVVRRRRCDGDGDGDSRSRSRLGSQRRVLPVRASIWVQASSSQASATISHQTWFCV